MDSLSNYIKGAGTEGAKTVNTPNSNICTEIASTGVASDIGICIGVAGLKSSCIKSTYMCTYGTCIGAWGTDGIEINCIKVTSFEDIYLVGGNTCVGGTCIRA